MKRFVIANNSVIKTRLGAKFMSAEDGKEYFLKKDMNLRVLDLMYTQDALLCGVDNTTQKYIVPYNFIVENCDLVSIQHGKVIDFAFILKNELKDNITVYNIAIAALVVNAIALIADFCINIVPYIVKIFH